MRNFFAKIILGFLSLSCLYISLYPKTVSAESEFILDSYVEYTFDEAGSAKVVQKFILENVYPTLYAKNYIINFESTKLKNVSAYDKKGTLNVTLEETIDTKKFTITFPEAVLGKGAKREFYFSYTLTENASKTGDVWEIQIPKLANTQRYRTFETKVNIPNTFGNEAYSAPQPNAKTLSDAFKTYIYNKESQMQSGITLGFGEFQVFSFVLNYHLENPLSVQSEIDIAVPPDTNFQKVYFDQVNPPPIKFFSDSEGNWYAKYNLKSRERKDILVSGSVQIFSKPKETPFYDTKYLSENLSAKEYWQSLDTNILKIAKNLKTPKNIYDFVINKLDYNYERVKPNVQRLGAVGALATPENAICMEFTDLFITLARAAGIPAREINGYAYTENPKIQPLSLVADVLHSWPEYWDQQKKIWIPVDPTWADTTGGVDFFNKLDLRHFTFVIHGLDPNKPYPPGSYKLGANPQKDVFVNLGKLPQDRGENIQITAKYTKATLFSKRKLIVQIENKGKVALYDLTPEIFFDSEKVDSKYIASLIPYSRYEFSIDVPYSFLGIKTPKYVSINLQNKKLTYPTYKQTLIMQGSIIIFILSICVISLLFYKLKGYNRLKFLNLFYEKIKNIRNKQRSTQNPS